MKLNAKSGLVWLIHCVNLTWICRTFLLRYFNQHIENNYLTDPIILMSIFLAIVLHIVRWRILGLEIVNRTFNSRIDLRRAISGVAAELFSGFAYLIKPTPADRAVEVYVVGVLDAEHEIYIRTKADLMQMLFQIKNFKTVHLIVIAIAAIGLVAGEAFNYSRDLKAIWFAIPILMCVLINLFIYSTATIVFLLVLYKSRS